MSQFKFSGVRRRICSAVALALASGVLLAENTADFANRVGTIRPSLHSAGYLAAFSNPSKEYADALLKDLNFAYSRTHDWALEAEGQRIVDTHFIFPVESADADDPNSYYFKATDEAIRLTRENAGCDIFFRLGNSIDKSDKHYNARPPKDVRKWAKVCANIIRHYNEGWNDGFHLGIRYWEIWNEPELNSQACWTGTMTEFFEFFGTVVSELRKAFPRDQYPDLRFGGPAFSAYSEGYSWSCIQNSEKKGALPDFISWHYYGTDVSAVTGKSASLHNFLRTKGTKYADIGTVIDEWHFCDWNSTTGDYDRTGVNSAAYTVACHCGFQNTADSNKFEVACFYGHRQTGSWGYTNSSGEPHHVYHALKMVGEVMTNCTDCCKTKASAPVYLLAGRSDDGRTGKLLVSYYQVGGADTSVSVRLAGLGDTPNVTRVERIAGSTATPTVRTDWTLADGVLTLPKPKGSAVFLVTFAIPEEEGL